MTLGRSTTPGQASRSGIADQHVDELQNFLYVSFYLVTVQCFGVFGFVFNGVLICFLGVWKFVVILGFCLCFKKELKAGWIGRERI